ncbi:TPA: hypothetical protein ACH3X2_013352 [Trebouxia sp. C0005]
MNKMCQIIGQHVVFSKTLSELGTSLKDLHDRLVRLQRKVTQILQATLQHAVLAITISAWFALAMSAGLFAAAMARAVLSEVNVADLRLLRAALEEEDRYSKEQIEAFLNTGKVRQYIPSPVPLAERLIKVMEEFINLQDPRNQVPVISAATWHTFLVNLKKVQQGWLSDPLPPDQMYYAVPVSKNQIRWIAVHGSSKLEGYHRWMNAQLSSGNTSPALAGALMRHRNGRWNIDCEIKNNKGTDYGIYDLSLVEEKSRLYQQLQMPNPYSDFKVLGPTKEKFGYDWDPSTVHAVLQVEYAQAAAPGPVEGQDQIFELMQGGSKDPLVEWPTMAAAKAIMADPAKHEAEQLGVQAQIAQVKETWREISGVAAASLPQVGPSASSAKVFDAGATNAAADPSRNWTADVDATPEDVTGLSRDWTADEDVNPEFLAELDTLEKEHSTGRRKQQGCPSSNAPPAETPLASAVAPSPRAQVSHPTPSLQRTTLRSCFHAASSPSQQTVQAAPYCNGVPSAKSLNNPGSIPQVIKAAIPGHNPCVYAAAFKAAFNKPGTDTSPLPD